jgi:hypothetical protein
MGILDQVKDQQTHLDATISWATLATPRGRAGTAPAPR